MDFGYFVLGIMQMELCFIIVLWMCLSGRRFLKGQIKDLIDRFTIGVMLVYGSVTSQFLIETFGVYGSLLEIPKYIFMMAGFVFFFWSAKVINELSKALGFGSDTLPERLKKILK